MNKYLFLATTILFTACHVGQEYNSNEFISDIQVKENLNIKNDIYSDITDDWYQIFKDKDLNTLIIHALKNNFSVKQAIERLKQSRYAFDIHAKDYYPMINGTGSYDFNRIDQQHSYAFDTNVFRLGLDASWEIDIWGKGSYISEKYAEFMNNVAYSLLDVKVSVTAEIVQNYINLREAQEKLRIAYYNLKLQKDILQTVKERYLAGMADDLELNQAQYTVESTQTSIPPLKFEIENYKNSLAVLLGVLPNKLPVNLDKYNRNIAANYFRYNRKKLNSLPLSVIRKRPDILAAEAKIKAQNAQINEAITALYPSISLGATFGFISTSGHHLFDNDSQVYGYSPKLSLPIWNWEQLKNNVELQKHTKEEYILDYNEAMLTALTEIKNAIEAVNQAYAKNQSSRQAFQKMTTILELTKDKYRNGLVDFTDVALAEQNLLKAQNELAKNNALILKSLTAFYKSIGGGYTF